MSKGRAENFTPDDDRAIARMVAEGRDNHYIGDRLGRTPRQITSRLYILRTEGMVPPLAGARPALPSVIDPGVIDHRKDTLLRSLCLQEGGFPRAAVIAGRTVWLSCWNEMWRHTPQAEAA